MGLSLRLLGWGGGQSPHCACICSALSSHQLVRAVSGTLHGSGSRHVIDNVWVKHLQINNMREMCHPHSGFLPQSHNSSVLIHNASNRATMTHSRRSLVVEMALRI